MIPDTFNNSEQKSAQKSNDQPHRPVLTVPSEKAQSQLWEALHERIRSQHETQLLRHVDETIQQHYPSYQSSDGRVIDRRLAQRIGVSPGTISRLRGDGGGAMTRLSHFLSMLYFCGGGWYEVGFMAPQQVVLDAIRHVFPLAQRLLGLAVSEPPTDEQILVLYFAFQDPQGKAIYAERQVFPGNFEDCCSDVFTHVERCEYDTEAGPERLIPHPRETTAEDMERVIAQNLPVWNLLLETFPFLGQQDRRGNAWGIF